MSNSSHDKTCPDCGTRLPLGTADGQCPRCLMAQIIEPTMAGDHASPIPTLTPEELAPHFPQLEILECLGRGGMGVVYKARQKSLNRFVALKLLAPERANDPQFATRFEKEAQALATLNHPHIVTIHDYGEVGGFFYLLMEFVDGVNLRQAMKAGQFTPEQALAIVPPVCEALQYAHEHGIVHRDIKPENLLLDKGGRIKIADFGIAKILSGDEATTSSDHPPAGFANNEATLASAAGTPQYMAPEQKEHRPTDHRADIYSLGVVLYEMLTGELPANKLQPPSRRVQIDVRLDEIVLRALEKTPELRYQTAGEFRTQVETLVAERGDGQRQADEAAFPERSSHHSSASDFRQMEYRLWVFGAVLLVLGGIAFFNPGGNSRSHAVATFCAIAIGAFFQLWSWLREKAKNPPATGGLADGISGQGGSRAAESSGTPRSRWMRVVAVMPFVVLAVAALFFALKSGSKTPAGLLRTSVQPVQVIGRTVIVRVEAWQPVPDCEIRMVLEGPALSGDQANQGVPVIPADVAASGFKGTYVMPRNSPANQPWTELNNSARKKEIAFVLPTEALAQAALNEFQLIDRIEIERGRTFSAKIFEVPAGGNGSYRAVLRFTPLIRQDSPQWVEVVKAPVVQSEKRIELNWNVRASRSGMVTICCERNSTTFQLRPDPASGLWVKTLGLVLTEVAPNRVKLEQSQGGSETMDGSFDELAREMLSTYASGKMERDWEIELCRFSGIPVTMQISDPSNAQLMESREKTVPAAITDPIPEVEMKGAEQQLESADPTRVKQSQAVPGVTYWVTNTLVHWLFMLIVTFGFYIALRRTGLPGFKWLFGAAAGQLAGAIVTFFAQPVVNLTFGLQAVKYLAYVSMAFNGLLYVCCIVGSFSLYFSMRRGFTPGRHNAKNSS